MLPKEWSFGRRFLAEIVARLPDGAKARAPGRVFSTCNRGEPDLPGGRGGSDKTGSLRQSGYSLSLAGDASLQ
jgi:hypothetical protein